MLLEAKVVIDDWRAEYNTIRPHSALGYRARPPTRQTAPTGTNPKNSHHTLTDR